MFSNSTRSRKESQAKSETLELAKAIASRNDTQIRYSKESQAWFGESIDWTQGIIISADSLNEIMKKMWSANIR